MKAFALGLLSCAAVALAQDVNRLKQALQDGGITAVFPEDASFANATGASTFSSFMVGVVFS